MQKRLFIVSNRLPVSIEQKDHRYTCRQSSGGLISAVTAYIEGSGKGRFSEILWVGAPGCSERIWNLADKGAARSGYNYIPVFAAAKQYELYYNGFSNSVLWPLFHYFPSFVDYHSSYFEAYEKMNELFADTISRHLRKDDVIWIHDYHLMPLAGIIRKRFPAQLTGFFLHVPFPSYELFRGLPKTWQKSLLEGMLGADLLGFHIPDYVSHFLECAGKILRIRHEAGEILWENRTVKTEALPIGIDFSKFYQAYDDPAVAVLRQEYLDLKGTRKLLFSVDRLDYTKGIRNRLNGYRKFLMQNPQYMDKVVFALVIVPSRDSISKYAERKTMIDELVSNINSSLGSINWQPVLYQYNHLSFEQLEALYTACDIALITPVRDGMNLVAKEFAASRKDKRGVLILSEMAGSAHELTEALLINPNDADEIAAAIRTGLEMPENEQARRILHMQQVISAYDVNAWAKHFFDSLESQRKNRPQQGMKLLDNFEKSDLLKKYSESGKRLILLDYDGTLMPFTRDPAVAAPSPELLDTLNSLAADPLNDIYIVSGRDGKTLEAWLGHLPIGLIAEHGAAVRRKNNEWEGHAGAKIGQGLSHVKTLLDSFISEYPKSFVEEKEYSLSWHYRNTGKPVQAEVLQQHLAAKLYKLPFDVFLGNKVIEIKASGINKGLAIQKLYENNAYDFIFCAGDDTTDEDMFKKLAGVPQACTIKVGNGESFAGYNLYTPYLVCSLLEAFVSQAKPAALPRQN